MAKQNPYSSPGREQHPVEVTKVWPNAPLPSPTPLPGKTTKDDADEVTREDARRRVGSPPAGGRSTGGRGA